MKQLFELRAYTRVQRRDDDGDSKGWRWCDPEFVGLFGTVEECLDYLEPFHLEGEEVYSIVEMFPDGSSASERHVATILLNWFSMEERDRAYTRKLYRERLEAKVRAMNDATGAVAL